MLAGIALEAIAAHHGVQFIDEQNHAGAVAGRIAFRSLR